ncbi:myb-like protein I [Senna tora]|uniref:Myb-like protein I n=1 Tax=Senna tora TaxID=362788 RepID=A0A834SLM8_9FABA|nr:myb-like protein I [Senna tora]
MGTKIEHSINLLATSADSNNNFSISGVDVWEHYQKKGLSLSNRNPRIEIIKLKDPIPMDRNLDRNNIESIKKTMQMHEDIFKHQVRELHRVYSVQKMLMDELKKEERQKNLWTPTINGLSISHPPPPHLSDQKRTQTSYGPDLQAHQVLRDNIICSSRERSGSCSGGDTHTTMKMPPQRGFDLARPAEVEEEEEEDEGGEAGPSSYNNDGNNDEEMEVDLTLSIGGSSSSQGKKKKEKPPHLLYSSASFKSDRGGGGGGDCSDPNTPMSSSSVTFDQERKGGTHNWLSQGLKLK